MRRAKFRYDGEQWVMSEAGFGEDGHHHDPHIDYANRLACRVCGFVYPFGTLELIADLRRPEDKTEDEA